MEAQTIPYQEGRNAGGETVSARYRKFKRLRYYRRSPAKLDEFAAACGLELCKYRGECVFCPEEVRDRKARTWMLMSYGECTEAVECVCANCLPEYYRDKMAELSQYGTRSYMRWHNHNERQWQAEQRMKRNGNFWPRVQPQMDNHSHR